MVEILDLNYSMSIETAKSHRIEKCSYYYDSSGRNRLTKQSNFKLKLFSSLQVLNVFVIFGSILIGGLVYHELQAENNNLKIRVSSLESSLTGKASTISLTSIIDSLNTLNTKHSNTCAAVRYWVESSANIKNYKISIKVLLKFMSNFH